MFSGVTAQRAGWRASVLIETARPLNQSMAAEAVWAWVKYKDGLEIASARGRVLTRYGMLATHLVEELGCGTAFSSMEFFESLTDALLDVGEGEEALAGGGILEDGFGFAVDGEDDGALDSFELLEEFGGVVAESGEGLGVLVVSIMGVALG